MARYTIHDHTGKTVLCCWDLTDAMILAVSFCRDLYPGAMATVSDNVGRIRAGWKHTREDEAVRIV